MPVNRIAVDCRLSILVPGAPNVCAHRSWPLRRADNDEGSRQGPHDVSSRLQGRLSRRFPACRLTSPSLLPRLLRHQAKVLCIKRFASLRVDEPDGCRAHMA